MIKLLRQMRPSTYFNVSIMNYWFSLGVLFFAFYETYVGEGGEKSVNIKIIGKHANGHHFFLRPIRVIAIGAHLHVFLYTVFFLDARRYWMQI